MSQNWAMLIIFFAAYLAIGYALAIATPLEDDE